MIVRPAVAAAVLGFAPLVAYATTTTATSAVTVTTTGASPASLGSPQNIGTTETLTTSVTYANLSSGTTTLAGRGTVVFCDHVYENTLGVCGTRAQVGFAQITSAGKATLTTRLSPGSHSLYARFVGMPGVTLADAASPLAKSDSSANLTAFTISGGSYALTNVLNSSGNIQTGYSLTDSLVSAPAAPAVVAPGNATVTDTTNSTTLGTPAFGAVGSSFTFSPGAPYGLNAFSLSNNGSKVVVKGDFNHDGLLDLVYMGSGGTSYSLLTAVANGTFVPGTKVSTNNSANFAAVGDFNNDGYLDIVYVATTNVYVLLNNGAGGFNAFVSVYTAAVQPKVVVVGDFNGDGYQDIAITGGATATGYIQILTNKGTATATTIAATDFTAQTAFASVNVTDGAAGVAGAGAFDIDGDGYTDLFVNAYQTKGQDSFYAGSAAGISSTPTAVISSTITGTPNSVAFADLHNDGVYDVVTAYSGHYDISEPTCSPSCTFNYSSIAVAGLGLVSASGVALADVNNDGILDLVFGSNLGNINVALGTGTPASPNGLSTSATTFAFGGFNSYPVSNLNSASVYNVVAGDFTGNGLQDIAVADYSGPTAIPVEVVFPGYVTTSAAISGISESEYSTNTQATASTSAYTGSTTSNMVGLTTGSFSLTASPSGGATYPATVTLTAQLSTTTVTTNGSTPSGIFTFYDGATVLGTATAASGAVGFTVPAANSSLGLHSYSVQYAGDSHYIYSTPIPSNTLSYAVTTPVKVTFVNVPSSFTVGSTPSTTVTPGTTAGVITAAEEDTYGNIVTNSTDILKLQVIANTPVNFNQTYATGSSYNSATVGYLTPTIKNGIATFDLSTLPLYSYGKVSPGVIYTFTLSSVKADGVTASGYASSTDSVYVYQSGSGRLMQVSVFNSSTAGASDPADSLGTAQTNCPDLNSSGATNTTLCTLRDALTVAASAANSSITFAFSGTAQTINITSTLPAITPPVGTTTTINGPGPDKLFISGAAYATATTPAYQIFNVAGAFAGTLNISGMTLEYGAAGALSYGGALNLSGTNVPAAANVNDVAFLYNTSTSGGGAVAIVTNSSTKNRNAGVALTINNSYFYGNSSVGNGGALLTQGGVGVNISNSVFTNNFNTNTTGNSDGGAISLDNQTLPTINVLTNDIFYNNTANNNYTSTGYGGAVYVGGSSTQNIFAVFNHCTVVGNKVTGTSTGNNGGGIYGSGSAFVTLINTIAYDNTAQSASSGSVGPDIKATITNVGATSAFTPVGSNATTTYASLAAAGFSDLGFYGGPFGSNTQAYSFPTLVAIPGTALEFGKGGYGLSSTVTTAGALTNTALAVSGTTGTFTITSTQFYVGEILTLPAGFPQYATYPGGKLTVLTTPGSTTFTATVPSGTTAFSAQSYSLAEAVVTQTVTAPATDLRGMVRTFASDDLGATQSALALNFVDQPANALPGNNITSTGPDGFPAVAVTDNGYRVNGASSLTLALQTGTLSGTLVATTGDNAVAPPTAPGITIPSTTSGLATFNSVYDASAGTGLVLVASGTNSPTVPTANSNTFNVVAAAQIVFGTTPATPIIPGGSPGTVTGVIEDTGGNVAPSTASVTLTVTGPSGFTTATYTVTAVNGVATFHPASLTISGTYTYALSAGSLTPPTPATELVTAATGSQLTVTGPATAAAGTNATYTVTYTDQYGNKVAGNTDTVQITTTDATATTSASAALVNSVGTFTVNYGTPGTYTVTATDTSGTATAGTSPATVVSKGSPTLTLGSSVTPSFLGSSVTFTATLSPYTAGTLTTNGGTITFLNNGVAIGTGTLSAGMATFTTTTLPVGSDVITAQYGGNTSFNAATTGNFTQTVTGDSLFIINSTGTVTSYSGTGAMQSTAVAGGGIGVAVDATGNVWSIDLGGNSVTKFTDTGTVSADYNPAAAGINAATALAIDGLGTTWIANGDGTVSALSNTGGAVLGQSVASAAAINTPASLKVDSSGSLWISSKGDNSVVEVIGVAAPVTTPTVTGVTNGTLGTRP